MANELIVKQVKSHITSKKQHVATLRALGLGKVVGEPTAGWIIFTWSVRLIDGSSFRLPRARITTADGSPMEMHPRPVDIAVTRPIGEGLSGKDSQLDAAVAELLKSALRRR